MPSFFKKRIMKQFRLVLCCLLIMGSFTLVAVNLDNMLGDLEAENEFLAYVDESYTEEQARDIKSQIEAIPNVSQMHCSAACCSTKTLNRLCTHLFQQRPLPISMHCTPNFRHTAS